MQNSSAKIWMILCETLREYLVFRRHAAAAIHTVALFLKAFALFDTRFNITCSVYSGENASCAAVEWRCEQHCEWVSGGACGRARQEAMQHAFVSSTKLVQHTMRADFSCRAFYWVVSGTNTTVRNPAHHHFNGHHLDWSAPTRPPNDCK